ncbi:unnamed protein product [Amoebophrya sp. A120]|nr:unnamed protein product [Amoebophrya sp. A120]|eukprot:GSA120T00001720001.1
MRLSEVASTRRVDVITRAWEAMGPTSAAASPSPRTTGMRRSRSARNAARRGNRSPPRSSGRRSQSARSALEGAGMSRADLLRAELASVLAAGGDGEHGLVADSRDSAPVPEWWNQLRLFVFLNKSKGCKTTGRGGRFTDDGAPIIFFDATTCLEKLWEGVVKKMGEVLSLNEKLKKELWTSFGTQSFVRKG